MSSESNLAQENVSTFSIKQIIGPLTAIIVGMFMVILDGTAMNVALPKLVEDFESKLLVVQWTVTGYALAQSAVIPLAGWLSDRFGAKRVFLFSVIMFTLGSLLCGLATTVDQLVMFRVIQGLGGGMVAPIAMAFTYRLSPPDKVGAIMGIIGIPMLLAPALGPILGGYLVEYVSWHWIFLINLPVGIAAVIVGWKLLPNIPRQSVPELDFLGIIFAPIAFAALAYGVTEGGESWTSTKTIVGLSVGFVALIIFIIAELRRTNPLLELRVFRSMSFTRGVIAQWINQVALFGSLFLVPLFLQFVKGYGALETGLIMLPYAIAAAIFMPIGGRLYDKVGARPVVITGMLLVISAALILSRTTDASVALMMLPLALLGSGMGLSMMPLNTYIIQSAPQNLVTRVTSLTGALQQVIASFAIAGLSTILTSRTTHHLEEGVSPDQVASMSYSDTYLVLAIVGIVGTLIGLTLKRAKKTGGEQNGDSSENKPDTSMMMGH